MEILELESRESKMKSSLINSRLDESVNLKGG